MAEHIPAALPCEDNGFIDSVKAGGMAVDLEEAVVPPSDSYSFEQAVRMLAHWLVSAARKGAPGPHSSPGEGPQNCLDVARDPKVVSKPEAGAMPVQQAVQRDKR